MLFFRATVRVGRVLASLDKMVGRTVKVEEDPELRGLANVKLLHHWRIHLGGVWPVDAAIRVTRVPRAERCNVGGYLIKEPGQAAVGRQAGKSRIQVGQGFDRRVNDVCVRVGIVFAQSEQAERVLAGHPYVAALEQSAACQVSIDAPAPCLAAVQRKSAPTGFGYIVDQFGDLKP